MLDIVPNDVAAVQELYRLLRPGGRLIITVMSKMRRHTLIRISFEEHVRNYQIDELSSLLVQSGFTVRGKQTFYRRAGGLARELGELTHRYEIGKVPGLNLAIDIILSTVTRLDALLPEDAGDGGFCIVADK